MTSKLSRRAFMLGTGAAASLAMTGCRNNGTREALSTTGTLDFTNRLAIPPLASSTNGKGGTREFTLTAQAGRSQFLPAKTTPTWGYDGAFLGPTIRAAKGEKVRITVTNSLEEKSTLHWHGMHLPAMFDGGPHQLIDPGATWTAEWTVDQPAATLWYHPHVHGQTEKQMTLGLAGMFIIDGEEPAPEGLPAEYGVDDIPVILQDRDFDEDGSFRMAPHTMTGLVGDTVLVNGTINPHLPVAAGALRLRLLNAATARIFNVGFDDDREFSIVASDGGLLARPAAVRRLLLSPGERAEVVVRFVPGERPVLRSFPQELGMSQEFNNAAGGNDVLDLLQFRTAGKLADSAPLPPTLTRLESVDAGIAGNRTFLLKEMYINGRMMEMSRIDEVVEAGTVERWNVSNSDNQPHSFHVHGSQFRILDINGSEPGPGFDGWKDTVFLPVRASARIAVHFGRYADPKLPYMYHCHLIWHADQGMMGQFTVVDPG